MTVCAVVKLYKVPGKRKKGKLTYNLLEITDTVSLQNSLARGWHYTLEDAAAAVNGSRLAVAPPAVSAIVSVPDDNAPPTREELEIQARKLGVRFDGRTGDKALLARINEALGIE